MQFDLWCWLVGFYDSFCSSSFMPEGSRNLPVETGPCEVLSIPFFCHCFLLPLLFLLPLEWLFKEDGGIVG